MEVFKQQQARGVCGRETELCVNSSEIIPSDCLFCPPDSSGHQIQLLAPESLDIWYKYLVQWQASLCKH